MFANPFWPRTPPVLAWPRLTLRAADVRLFDMVRRDAAVQKQKLWELLQMMDIWNLRSFRGQKPRERAWNAATRMLPALTWLVKYNVRKQLFNDIAAGIAVSFLIVPQVCSAPGGATRAALTPLLPRAGAVLCRRGGAACHPGPLCVPVACKRVGAATHAAACVHRRGASHVLESCSSLLACLSHARAIHFAPKGLRAAVLLCLLWLLDVPADWRGGHRVAADAKHH